MTIRKMGIRLQFLLLLMFSIESGFASVHSASSEEMKSILSNITSMESNDKSSALSSKETSEHGSSEQKKSEGRFPVFPGSSARFMHATIAAISVIVVSEIGDKTFFIAVILSMKHSRILIFLGAVLALVLMTVLSALLGQLTTIIPRMYVHYTSVILFILFGLKMLKEGYYMSTNDQSEYDDVHKEIENRESKLKVNMNGSVESGVKVRRKAYISLALVFFEAFTMTFLAEWGDRSQLTTIVLAARENVFGVIFGAIVGHAACTFLAVVGGRLIADRISVKLVTLIGGVVFLAFAVWAIVAGPGTSNPSELNLKYLSKESYSVR